MCSRTHSVNWPENLEWISQRLYRMLKEEIQMERMKVEDMVKALKCVEEQLEKQIPKEPKYKKISSGWQP